MSIYSGINCIIKPLSKRALKRINSTNPIVNYIVIVIASLNDIKALINGILMKKYCLPSSINALNHSEYLVFNVCAER